MVNTRRRKKPRRRSGEDIVEAILVAAGELLVDGGMARMTTNAIARRAGVSVGSVYQYFPNKEAICAGVTRRVNQSIVSRMQEAVEADRPLRERVRLAVRAVCSADVGTIPLRRKLIEEVPRAWADTGLHDTESQILSLVLAQLREDQPHLSDEEARQRALIAVFTVRGVVQGAILYQPESLENGDLAKRLDLLVQAAMLD